MKLLLILKKRFPWRPRPQLPREKVSVLDSIVNDKDWYQPKDLKKERREHQNIKRPTAPDQA